MLSAKAFFTQSTDHITPEQEEEFFSSIMVRNGTYKTTYRGRFSEVDGRIADYLAVSGSQACELLDVGVSSGTSTVELYDTWRAKGINVEITATDILTDAYLVEVFPKCFALIDDSGFPLRFDLFGRTMKPWVVRADYKSGVFVVRKIINKLFTRRAHRLRADDDANRVMELNLISPRLARHDHIHVRSQDIREYNESYFERFDVVRTANILNKSYFDADGLCAILHNIARYLKPNTGLLFVVRTHDDHSNHGTLFRIDGTGKFNVLWRIGKGSEIEEIVLSC